MIATTLSRAAVAIEALEAGVPGAQQLPYVAASSGGRNAGWRCERPHALAVGPPLWKVVSKSAEGK